MQAAGWRVKIVDKGRVAGGRMATRTFDEGRFDYGAQFFTTRDAAFAEVARSWIDSGLAVPWSGHRFRAAGGMRALAETLAAGLDVVMDRCVKIEHGRLFGGLNWAGVNTRIVSSKRPRQLPY